MNTKLSFLLIPLLLTCFALLGTANATPDPATVAGSFNTADGLGALGSPSLSGEGNTAVGYETLAHNTIGSFNTGIGDDALERNTGGGYNTAIGTEALFGNQTGIHNTATGYLALELNSYGTQNTATGSEALSNNIGGGNNTATGYQALFNNTTENGVSGSSNTADGAFALYSNRTGVGDTAVGGGALYSNTASNNTAMGSYALYFNTGGTQNAAIGVAALLSNTIGNNNTATGVNALLSNVSGTRNTAAGASALYKNAGGSNLALGFQAGYNLTTGSGNVCIGAGVLGVAGESNTTRIRNIYSSVASARAVYIGSDNKLGTLSSSRRYKEEIKPMDNASETLFALKPVSFRYKKEVDAERALSFGLIAEDVAKVSPDLITRDEKGNPQTVRYEAVNAMLLNEFLKEHKTVQQQGQTIARLEKQLVMVTATLQKVSAQLEMSKAVPQVVNNP